MSDFQIGGIREPFDPKKIERIGEEHPSQEKEKQKKKKKPSGALLFMQYCLSLKEALAKFPSMQKISLKDLHAALHHLELSFKELTKSDLSENASFLKELSTHWMKFARAYQPFFARQDTLSKQISLFLNEVHAYPPGAEFSLGYYLSKFAGLDWIPFPYMEMLKKLFEEHKNNPQGSLLHQWIEKLENFQK